MQFNEQPLSYEEARRAVQKFEHQFKVDSAVVFSGGMDPDPRICSDALYEWKSYYDFISEVDRTIAKALNDEPVVHEVIYASSTTESRPRSYEEQKAASMKYAA
jgi:hypothetical protein